MPASTKEDDKEAREFLFAAVEGDNEDNELLSCRPLVSLMSSSRRSTVVEMLQAFHKGHARRFFAGVGTILQNVVENESYVPASAYESDDEDDNRRGSSPVDPSDITPDPQSTEALNFIRAAATCLETYLEGLVDRRSEEELNSTKKSFPLIDEAFVVTELLHSLLFPLHSCGLEGLQVQSTIASMCEYYWNYRFVDRECMIVQLIPMVVSKSLAIDAPKTDVKRVFQLREALDVLDFEDESIEYLRSLLLRTVSSPNYLRQTEGKRFIAGLFQVDPSLIGDLHQAIRVQIPDAKKTVLQAYGEIYMRAWKESEGETRTFVEETCLQDLMYAVLHVQNAKIMESIQTMLQTFHNAKKTPEIETLLHRMYGPILWRSLSAANPGVRVNAAAVLTDVFPLQPNTLDHRETERAVKKGTSALKSLLGDSDPRVRVAGSEAAASILCTYWDVLPTTDIRILLNHIVAEHASDASSSAVRVSALSSITTLLDAEQSHAVLRTLLPSLGNLIHDKVERVRIATVRLLLRIKQIKGIKYYHVVPVDHLTARLAEEGRGRSAQGPVASALTELMLNSYFPQGPNFTGADQVKRTISFLSSDPAAASVFYSNVSAHLSVSSVAKLAAMLLRCLVSAVETDKARLAKKGGRKRRRGYGKQRGDDDEEEQDEDDATESNDGGLSASNTALMASLAETICDLWESIETELKDPQNEASHEYLFEAFSGAVLTNAHAHFDQKAADCDESTQEGSIMREDCYRTCAAILRCAGRLPPKAVEGLASRISAKLSSLDDDLDAEAVHESISPHVALLCLWGLGEDVASSLSLSIKSAFGVDDELRSPAFDEPVGNSKKRRSARGKAKEDLAVPVLPGHVALGVLGDILRGSDPSSIAAREAILSSATACSAFESALELGTVRAERLLQSASDINEDEVELALKACEAYGRFALHKEAARDGLLTFNDQAKTLLDWTTKKVVPVLLNTDANAESPLRDLNISRISAVDESLLQPGSPSPMPPPKQRVNRNPTPERFADRSFPSTDRSDTLLADAEAAPLPAVSHGAAVSLMQSSCAIFSEWLTVGGPGADVIAAAVSKWCLIFSTSQDSVALHAELLPSFMRLVAQLSKSGEVETVLRPLLVNCDGVSDQTEEFLLLQKTITSLLVTQALMGPTVGAVLEAAHELLELKAKEGAKETNHDLPETIAELWASSSGSIVASISAILSNKQASFAFAEHIVHRLAQDTDTSDTKTIALFDARCLYLLCERTADRGEWAAKNALRSLAVDQFEEESPVHDVIQGVLDTFA